MAKIKPLPPGVISKIAAGEVVERPASIVKELVENALDAGSRSIRVELLGGGLGSIRVEDDGEGMTAEDALLALQRYSTSKIEKEEDLFALESFGFRGEALSSIAAVSKMKVVTRRAGAESGVALRIEAGVVKAQEEIGCPIGTLVEVRDLFFNLPARLKFLKTPATELGHIGEVMGRMALASPAVRFQLFHGGKLLAHYPVRNDPASRLAELLGTEEAGKMNPFGLSRGEIRAEGFAGEPGLDRPNPRGIYLFVNRRPVRDRLLSHAVMEAYRNLLPKDRYPMVILFLQLRPQDVDVNVHPSKWEVKFADSEAVHRTVVLAIRGMLDKAPWLGETPQGARGPWEGIRESAADYYFPPGNGSLPAGQETLNLQPGSEGAEPAWANRFLGQVDRTYLLFASGDGLVIVDQHAAHERIVLEGLLDEFSQGAIRKQPLLLPEMMELSLAETQAVEEHRNDLENLGFEIEPVGEKTFRLDSVPEILAGREPLRVLREMVREIASWGKQADLQRSTDPLLHMMACHGAIQASQALSAGEAATLWDGLQRCISPSRCPHGRPTMLRMTRSDLEKMFQRR